MREAFPDSGNGSTTIEVSVFRDGECVARVRVETEEEAAEVVDAWSEQEGVLCLVDDLSVHHRFGEILEPLEGELADDERRDDRD